MSVAGGILSVVVGVFGFFTCLTLGIVASVLQAIKDNPAYYDLDPEAIPAFIAVFWVVSIFMLIPSIISVIGGIFAIKRNKWGWALAGSICAVLCSNILGVVALVFIIMGKKEFSEQGDKAIDSPA